MACFLYTFCVNSGNSACAGNRYIISACVFTRLKMHYNSAVIAALSVLDCRLEYNFFLFFFKCSKRVSIRYSNAAPSKLINVFNVFLKYNRLDNHRTRTVYREQCSFLFRRSESAWQRVYGRGKITFYDRLTLYFDEFVKLKFSFYGKCVWKLNFRCSFRERSFGYWSLADKIYGRAYVIFKTLCKLQTVDLFF